MGPSVVIIGASGNIGRPLVDEFIRNLSKFSRVGVLTASPSKFTKQHAQGIEVITGSFLNPESYRGFDIAISVAGNSIMRLQPAMIEAAVAGGVSHFYPSEFGSDVGSAALRDFRYFRDKRVTRDHLVAVAKQNPNFKYTLMITGPFTEWAVDALYGVDRTAKTVRTYGSGNARIDVTSIPDVARYTVDSMLLPMKQGQQRRELRVVGESTTFQGLIDILGEVEGAEYTCTYLPVSIASEEEEKARKADDEEQVLFWSARTLGAGGNAVIGGPADNHYFDFKPESVHETFRREYGGKQR